MKLLPAGSTPKPTLDPRPNGSFRSEEYSTHLAAAVIFATSASDANHNRKPVVGSRFQIGPPVCGSTPCDEHHERV